MNSDKKERLHPLLLGRKIEKEIINIKEAKHRFENQTVFGFFIVNTKI